MRWRSSSLLALGIGAVTLTAVVAGLAVTGSPAEARRHRVDERRVTDLRQIGQAVDVFWTRKSHLPSSPAELTQDQGPLVELTDPVTGSPYEYEILGPRSYRLCAAFDTTAERQNDPPFWTHGSGRQCFDLEVKTASR